MLIFPVVGVVTLESIFNKVLLPACTWVTNINPIFQLGLQPIFCDINLINYSFDEENLKRISEKHTDIKVVFVTHLLGLTAPVEKYKEYFPDAIFIDDSFAERKEVFEFYCTGIYQIRRQYRRKIGRVCCCDAFVCRSTSKNERKTNPFWTVSFNQSTKI